MPSQQADPDAASGVELRSLTKVFGTTTAVDGIDLDIADGEFFAMLGPSGSGKTTVLRMIAGFETPTSGTVRLGGVDVTNQPANRRDVSTVFQDYALFPHMSVAENVAYGLKVRGVGKTERTRRVGEALDMVRLGDRGERRPSELSGGQRQRVALARALVTRPRVLLLDEPLGALDLKLREQMQVELKTIQREVGITFLFVTHDQDEALTLCDRLAVFNAGRIEQIGAPDDVYEHPASQFVAGFVGSSNVISGAAAREITGRDGTFSVRPEKVSVHPLGAVIPDGPRLETVVSEVVYAGPITRIVATRDDLTVSSVVLNSTAGLSDVARGDHVVLTWPESAQRELTE